MSAFEPEWKGPIEGYVVNFLTKNHWKIVRTCPREDALQEAYCVFLRVKRKYTGKVARGQRRVTEPRHFMALFKTAWYNQFTELANLDTAQRVECTMPVDDEGNEFELTGSTDNDGMLAVMIREAPREVTMVLSLLLNAPQELLDAALGTGRQNACVRVNRLLGLPLEQDTLGTVAEYFR